MDSNSKGSSLDDLKQKLKSIETKLEKKFKLVKNCFEKLEDYTSKIIDNIFGHKKNGIFYSKDQEIKTGFLIYVVSRIKFKFSF
jgi:hypothetical protein